MDKRKQVAKQIGELQKKVQQAIARNDWLTAIAIGQQIKRLELQFVGGSAVDNDKIDKYLVRTADSLEVTASPNLIGFWLFLALFWFGASLALVMSQNRFMKPFYAIAKKARAVGWKPGKRLPQSLLNEIIEATENIPANKLQRIKDWAESQLSQKQLEEANLHTTAVDMQKRALQFQVELSKGKEYRDRIWDR